MEWPARTKICNSWCEVQWTARPRCNHERLFDNVNLLLFAFVYKKNALAWLLLSLIRKWWGVERVTRRIFLKGRRFPFWPYAASVDLFSRRLPLDTIPWLILPKDLFRSLATLAFHVECVVFFMLLRALPSFILRVWRLPKDLLASFLTRSLTLLSTLFSMYFIQSTLDSSMHFLPLIFPITTNLLWWVVVEPFGLLLFERLV